MLELRPTYTMEDFAELLTPEHRAQIEQMERKPAKAKAKARKSRPARARSKK